MNKKINKLIFIFLCLVTNKALTAGWVPSVGNVRFPANEGCQDQLKPQSPGRLILHASASDSEQERLRWAAEHFREIAARTGWAVPNSQYNIIPGNQLNAMATTGHHPAPHGNDGAKIVHGLRQRLGVMEFAQPGYQICRSCFSDHSGFNDLVGIMTHVIGHDDSFTTWNAFKNRKGDPMRASLGLARELEQASAMYPKDEVDLYYQYLQSLVALQDFSYATFQSPEDLDLKNFTGPRKSRLTISDPNLMSLDHDSTHSNLWLRPREPWKKTLSGLQALTTMLADSAPLYKKNLLRLFEQTVRFYPAIAVDQVSIEGWAVLAQYVLPRHSEVFGTSEALVDLAQLMGLVMKPDLKNHYYVGGTGYYNLYQKFVHRPEIRDLPEDKKDLRFKAWANNTLNVMSPFEKLQIILDQDWFKKRDLFLFRKTLPSEIDPKRPKEQQGYIALSRHPDRLRLYLYRQRYNSRRTYPLVSLLNSEAKGLSVLEFQHEIYDDMPLEPVSAVKTLFAITQIIERPVSLSTIVSSLIFSNDSKVAPTTIPIRFDVAPDGTVKAMVAADEPAQAAGVTEAEIEGLSAALTAQVQAFRDDVHLGFDDQMVEEQIRRWQKLVPKIQEFTAGYSRDYAMANPTASAAIFEYFQMIERRLPKAIKDLVAGKTPLKTSKRGVRVRIVPEVPQFMFDPRHLQAVSAHAQPAPVDPHLERMPSSFSLQADDYNVQIGSGPFLPGDTFGDPAPEKKSSPEGSGEEEGESSDKESPPEPNEIEIPFEVYTDILIEELELPNLRKTGGQNPRIRMVKQGSAHKPSGDIVMEKTAGDALAMGLAARKAKGLPISPAIGEGATGFYGQVLKEGLLLLDPADYVRRDWDQEREPQMRAVLGLLLDTTPSMMQGQRLQVAKNLAFHLRLILKRFYPDLEQVFIKFDEAAEEVSEEKFWTISTNGTTRYAPPLIKAKQIFDERYPKSKYNRFIAHFGDGETSDISETVTAIRDLFKELQYYSLVITGHNELGALGSAVDGLQSEWPWVGVAAATSETQIPQVLKTLYGKKGQRAQ